MALVRANALALARRCCSSASLSPSPLLAPSSLSLRCCYFPSPLVRLPSLALASSRGPRRFLPPRTIALSLVDRRGFSSKTQLDVPKRSQDETVFWIVSEVTAYPKAVLQKSVLDKVISLLQTAEGVTEVGSPAALTIIEQVIQEVAKQQPHGAKIAELLLRRLNKDYGLPWSTRAFEVLIEAIGLEESEPGSRAVSKFSRAEALWEELKRSGLQPQLSTHKAFLRTNAATVCSPSQALRGLQGVAVQPSNPDAQGLEQESAVVPDRELVELAMVIVEVLSSKVTSSNATELSWSMSSRELLKEVDASLELLQLVGGWDLLCPKHFEIALRLLVNTASFRESTTDKEGAARNAEAVLSVLEKLGDEGIDLLQAARGVIYTYSMADDLQSARQVFENKIQNNRSRTRSPGLEAYTLALLGNPESAEKELFREFPHAESTSIGIAGATVIWSFARNGSLQDALRLFSIFLREQKLCWKPDLLSSVMFACLKANDPLTALQCYEDAKRNELLSEASASPLELYLLMRASISSGNAKRALEVFETIQKRGVKPNILLSNKAMQAALILQNPQLASKIFAESVKAEPPGISRSIDEMARHRLGIFAECLRKDTKSALRLAMEAGQRWTGETTGKPQAPSSTPAPASPVFDKPLIFALVMSTESDSNVEILNSLQELVSVLGQGVVPLLSNLAQDEAMDTYQLDPAAFLPEEWDSLDASFLALSPSLLPFSPSLLT